MGKLVGRQCYKGEHQQDARIPRIFSNRGMKVATGRAHASSERESCSRAVPSHKKASGRCEHNLVKQTTEAQTAMATVKTFTRRGQVAKMPCQRHLWSGALDATVQSTQRLGLSSKLNKHEIKYVSSSLEHPRRRDAQSPLTMGLHEKRS